MRSTKLRRKRRSCPLCKPQKTGGAPKDTERQQADEIEAEREIRDALVERQEPHPTPTEDTE